MSETQPDPNEWVWQGWEADAATAAARKAAMDYDPRHGAILPQPGDPPLPWNTARTRAIWAVQTRRGNPIPTPAGCDEADPAIVGRLVGG